LEIKDYISSGVLELYVLGKLDAQENAAVELMASQHPEVRAELDAIELALEVYAQGHGQTPPPGTLGEIFRRANIQAPAPQASFSFLTAALALATIIGIIVAIWAYNNKGRAEAQVADVQQQLNVKTVDCDAIARENTANRAELEFLKDVGTKPIIMRGTPDKDPAAIASVYVNPQQNKAYLNIVSLPPAPPGKQYQLWAIVGTNAPTDMGVFDLPPTPGQLKEIAYRADFAGAVTFAVTLEDAGGKPSPDLTQLFLIS